MRQKEPIFNFSEPSIPIVIVVFALVYFLGTFVFGANQMYANFALLPLNSPDLPAVPIRQAYALLTHGFLHGDLGHLIMNSAFLLIFGAITFRGVRALKGYGLKAFICFWIIFWASVVVGGLFQWGHWTLENATYASAVGASGGVSGLFATAGWAIGGKKGMAQFAVAHVMLNILLAFTAPGIAWAAHIGGYVAGAGLAPYWVKPESAGISIFR